MFFGTYVNLTWNVYNEAARSALCVAVTTNLYRWTIVRFIIIKFVIISMKIYVSSFLFLLKAPLI